MDRPLILSLFPGIGLLDRAFEEIWPEACLVRGPDVLWGGDVRQFNPPAGVFGGIIGGPPCQMFSVMQFAVSQRPVVNLIPEFERVVSEAQPQWFVMENVRRAPLPVVDGYQVRDVLLNNRWVPDEGDVGPAQNRQRRFSFGTRDGRCLQVDVALFENPVWEYAVVGGHDGIDHGRQKWGQGTQDVRKMCRLQGLPEDYFKDSPLTVHGQRRALGNAVPLPMGRAIAAAVKRAMYAAEEAE